MKEGRQLHFADVQPTWPVRTSTLVMKDCQEIYQQALRLWQQFGISIPQEIPTEESSDQFSLESHLLWQDKPARLTCYPIFDYPRHNHPRIRDIQIPEQFQGFLGTYIQSQQYGRNTYLPNMSEVYLGLYHHYPIKPKEDTYGVLATDADYTQWLSGTLDEWWKKADRNCPKFVGWKAGLQDLSNPNRISFFAIFSFSPKGKLASLSLPREHPQEQSKDPLHRSLETKVKFRQEALYSLWHEEANGTLFPDPRGEKDTRWPYWLKDPSGPGKAPATSKDWDGYLERVRRRQPVVSGATGKLVLQTEDQARKNLEAAQERSYYSHPQVFSFKRMAEEPGFVGSLGYCAYGPYGLFLVKNATSFRTLSFNETIPLLDSSTSQMKQP